jgi:Fe-S-cluster containining protein
MSLCDRCRDPGACCRDIALNIDPDVTTKLEALAWVASIRPGTGEIGLPFIPIERRAGGGDEAFERWIWSCIYLQPDGRCGNYDGRPQMCRNFEPGVSQPCAMTCPKELPVGGKHYPPTKMRWW